MGIAWTLLLIAPPLLGAYALARRGFGQPPGLPRALATGVLSWTWIILGSEILGSLGWLSRGPLLAWSMAGGGIGLLSWRIGRDHAPDKAAIEPPARWDWPAILGVGLLFTTVAGLGGRSLLGPVKVVSDGPIYHLYFAARWWKAGLLFGVATPFGENAATYFPAVGDLGFSWLMVAWGGDRLARVGQAPFLLLAGLASYAMARDLGARASASALAACWFLMSSPLLLFTFEPNVDTVFAAGYLASAYFFLRFVRKFDGRNALILGGLAAGGAWGTKPTATVFVPPLLALAGVAVLARRDWAWRRRVAGLGILVLAPMVMAGFWFGRNAVWTGNPLYPLDLALGGRTILAGWYDREAMRSSPYYLAPDDLASLADTLAAVLDPRLAPLWALAVAGGWTIARRDRRPASRWAWLLSALTLVNLALYWGLIPYRNQQRFMLHALGLAAVPLALLFDRARWLRVAASLLIAVHLLTPSHWPLDHPFWDFSPRIPSIFPPLLTFATPPRPTSPADPFAWNLLYGVLLASIALAWALGRPSRFRSLRVVAILGVWMTLADRAAFPVRPLPPLAAFYPSFPDYQVAWLRLDQASGPDGARVAYAGTNIPYYLMGVGLRNEVRYVNVDAHPAWLPHDYHQAAGRPHWPNSRPGWDRAHPDPVAWLENLRREGIEFLFIARADPREGAHNVADAQGFPIERQWADARPADFRRFHADPRVRLYRVLPGKNPPGPDGSHPRGATTNQR